MLTCRFQRTPKKKKIMKAINKYGELIKKKPLDYYWC